MALEKCWECARSISSEARRCPHCGADGLRYRKPAGVRGIHLLGAGLFLAIGLGLLGAVVGSGGLTPAPSISSTGITIGAGCRDAVVDKMDEFNRAARQHGAPRRILNLYCHGDGTAKRVWLTGNVPWEANEGTVRLAARFWP